MKSWVKATQGVDRKAVAVKPAWEPAERGFPALDLVSRLNSTNV